MGLTGLRLIRAIVAGERDPQALAQLRHERCHASAAEIAKALSGHYRPEHVFALKQALALYDFYTTQVHEYDTYIEQHYARFRRKVKMETSVVFTFSDLCGQSIALLRRRLRCIPSAYQLAFANRMPHPYAGDRTAGRPKGLETQHGTRQPFPCPMVLLDDVIEIFRVADDKRGLLRLIVVRDCCRVTATLVDRDVLWESLTTNSFA